MITYPLNRIEYQATDAELFHVTRTSGIYAGDHFGYSITGADNNITIDIGIAWIKNGFFSGKVAASTTPEIIDCGIADASLPRWDIICVQFDKNENATAIVVKKGRPESAPIVPAVEQAETIFELCLYRIYRPAGSVSIVPENIYDTRLDPNVCGLMADSVTSVDTEAINAQVTALIRKLNQAITDTAAGVGEVNEYIQSGDVDNLILDGVGTNGKFKSLVEGTVTTATVNSETYTVNAGSENEIELASNSWYLFVLDTERKTINFNQGGGLSNNKLKETTATENTVIAGYTFYSKNKELKTGAMKSNYDENGNYFIVKDGVLGDQIYKGDWSQGDEYVQVKFSSGETGYRALGNLVDLTDFSTMTIEVQSVSVDGTSRTRNFYIANASGNNVANVAVKGGNVSETVTLDISSLTGFHYIQPRGQYSSMLLKNVFLEK